MKPKKSSRRAKLCGALAAGLFALMPTTTAAAAGDIAAAPTHTASSRVVGIATDRHGGFWIAFANGEVEGFDGAPQLGSAYTKWPVVSMTATQDGRGVWLLDSGGFVTALGDARGNGPSMELVGAGTTGIVAAPTRGFYAFDSWGLISARQQDCQYGHQRDRQGVLARFCRRRCAR